MKSPILKVLTAIFFFSSISLGAATSESLVHFRSGVELKPEVARTLTPDQVEILDGYGSPELAAQLETAIKQSPSDAQKIMSSLTVNQRLSLIAGLSRQLQQVQQALNSSQKVSHRAATLAKIAEVLKIAPAIFAFPGFWPAFMFVPLPAVVGPVGGLVIILAVLAGTHMAGRALDVYADNVNEQYLETLAARRAQLQQAVQMSANHLLVESLGQQTMP